jgi:hypothetical protein
MCKARCLRVPVDCCCEHVGLCRGREPSGRRGHRGCRGSESRPEGVLDGGVVRVGGGPGCGQGVGHGLSARSWQAVGEPSSETRTFKTKIRSLRVMRDWLFDSGVTIAAMGWTWTTYWRPPFYCLEASMEVWLLNAAHMKAVPGRKSDVRDAECPVARARVSGRRRSFHRRRFVSCEC